MNKLASQLSIAIALAAAGVGAFACSSSSDSGPLGESEQYAQPIDRMLIGKAAKYPADTTLLAQTPVLEASMAARRKAAWTIVQKVLAPIKIAAHDPNDHSSLSLPRFETWYSKDDILPMFDHLFRSLSDADKTNRSPFTAQAIASVFPWNTTMATSLASFTQERLDARKQELATSAGLHSLSKDTRVLMSPDYVEHLFSSYNKILDCKSSGASSLEDPNVFAPCMNGEFPAAAAAVKTRWMPNDAPTPTYDTSAPSLAQKLTGGTFGDGDGQANPDDAHAYTMQLTEDTSSPEIAKAHLVALHIMTKELRDWAWITLWWSPDPDTDFGADRPASLTGVFANYKMCVVTAYSEKDAAPGSSFLSGAPTLAASLDVVLGDGPSTWCSNPYLETPLRAAKTSCIGCHQHGGTGETTESILGDPNRFPDFARTKLRVSFPSDYAYTTEGGLDLAAEFRSRVEALTPPQ